MPEKSDDSKELQKEILLELQRITDRLDLLTHYEEKEPTWVFHLGWVAAFLLFFASILAGLMPAAEAQRFGEPEKPYQIAPVLIVGVFFVMVIMFCQTYVSRRVSPANLAWEREQERKRLEKAKKSIFYVENSTSENQQNIQRPF